MRCRLITNPRKPFLHLGFSGEKPTPISPAGDRAGDNVAFSWATIHLQKKQGGLGVAKRLAECHLPTESRSLEGGVQESALITRSLPLICHR